MQISIFQSLDLPVLPATGGGAATFAKRSTATTTDMARAAKWRVTSVSC